MIHESYRVTIIYELAGKPSTLNREFMLDEATGLTSRQFSAMILVIAYTYAYI